MNAGQENPLLPLTAIVEEKIIESKQVYSLRLSLLDGKKFDFRPGQFTMLGLPGVGEAPFTFSSLPLDAGKSFIHTIHLAGNVTTAISRLGRNDSVQVRGPYGNGWPLERVEGKNVVIIAGGVGIAPLRPVIRLLLENDKCRRVSVIYGAKKEEDLLFRDEYVDWRGSGKLSLMLACEEAPSGGQYEIRQCLVTALLDKIDVPLKDSVTFTCGPGKMMGLISSGLVERGQDAGDIYVTLQTRMRCGIGHCGHCQVGQYFVCKDGPVFAYSDISRALDTPV